MQPYFVPYIGYWRLIKAADCFVFLDDVNFIKRGWVNRNRVRASKGGAECTWIRVPVCNASQNRKINEHIIDNTQNWKKQIMRQMEHIYGKAEYVEEGIGVVQETIGDASANIADFNIKSIIRISKMIGAECEFLRSSVYFGGSTLKGSKRIIEICNTLEASNYINPSGGKLLYDSSEFINAGISLEFMREEDYFRSEGFGTMSIVDVIMTRGCATVKRSLENSLKAKEWFE